MVKQTECAAVETDLLLNDGEGAPEIYNVATMLDQAKLGFNACYKMVRQSPTLRKHIRKRAAIYMRLPILGLLRHWQATQTVWTA